MKRDCRVRSGGRGQGEERRDEFLATATRRSFTELLPVRRRFRADGGSGINAHSRGIVRVTLPP